MILGDGTLARIVAGPPAVGLPDWQVEPRLRRVGIESTGDALNALNGVQPEPGSVDRVGIEPARSLACIGHTRRVLLALVAAVMSAERSRPCKSIVRSNRPPAQLLKQARTMP